MILTILGLAVIIVSTYYVHKTAKDYGRNAILWSVGTFVLGIGIQWVLPILLTMVLAVIFVMQGTRNPNAIQEQLSGPAFVIGIASLVLSGVAMWLMLKMVSRLPDEPDVDMPPPPPTDFR